MQKSKFSFLLLSLLLTAFNCFAEDYQIKNLNTPTISIDGKEMKVGDWFGEDAVINWKNDSQAMRVLSSTNRVYTLSAKRYRASKSKKFVDFIAFTKPLASRGFFTTLANELRGWSMRNQHLVWTLLDEIEVSFDDDTQIPEGIQFFIKQAPDSTEVTPTTRTPKGFTVNRDDMISLCRDSNPEQTFVVFIKDDATGAQEEIIEEMRVEVLPLAIDDTENQ